MTAADSWSVDCALDAQAEGEATEKALDNLFSHEVVEQIQVPHDVLGERLANESWRVEDESEVRGPRIHVS